MKNTKIDKRETQLPGGKLSDASTCSVVLRDAARYRAIKEKIEYGDAGDGMAWATLNWCVEVYSLSPSDLDEAIDQLLLPNVKLNRL